MAFATWVYIFVYLFLRLVRGKCGGFKTAKPRINKKNKLRPMFLIFIGTGFFIFGFITVVIAQLVYT